MSVPIHPQKKFLTLFSVLLYKKEQFWTNKSRYIRRYRELYSSSKPIFSDDPGLKAVICLNLDLN